MMSWLSQLLNPLRPTAIPKLLEIIGRVRLYPSCSFATALNSDINQTTGSGGHLSMWENRCMHAAVCLLRAGQPRSAGDAAKLGQFVGQFSWVTGDPTGLKGLNKGLHYITICMLNWFNCRRANQTTDVSLHCYNIKKSNCAVQNIIFFQVSTLSTCINNNWSQAFMVPWSSCCPYRAIMKKFIKITLISINQTCIGETRRVCSVVREEPLECTFDVPTQDQIFSCCYFNLQFILRMKII